MKQQIKLTESELHMVIEGAVKSLLREYGETNPKHRDLMAKAAARGLKKGNASVYDNAVKSIAKGGGSKDALKDFNDKWEKHSGKNLEEEGFNEQPTNDVVGENKLYRIIKESVKNVLQEIGDTHRFHQGKYGLAMDAADKAKALGRTGQAANFEKYGSDEFNKLYGTPDFEMDEYGQLRHKGTDGKERMYRPQSKLDRIKRVSPNNDRYDNAVSNNYYIKNSANTAKAFPRKKMTGGLKAIDDVDNKLNSY